MLGPLEEEVGSVIVSLVLVVVAFNPRGRINRSGNAVSSFVSEEDSDACTTMIAARTWHDNFNGRNMFEINSREP